MASAQISENAPYGNSEDLGFFGQSRNSIHHFAILMEYGISDDLSIELQGIYERAGVQGGVYHFPVLAKYYTTKKLYVLGGPAVDFFLNETSGQPLPSRISGVLGAGYDVKENLFLQLQGDFTIQEFNKKSNVFSRPNTLTVTSGFKF
ncbi:MAG: hypothetical protein AAFO99_12915 [Bacteroidota bacterium]